MPNPQLENGYLKIACEISEQFCRHHLTGNEWMCLWVVIRKTWGWNKKKDKISLTQFENETGLFRKQVVDAVGSLVRKMILVRETSLSTNTYQIQKDYSQWSSDDKRTSAQIRTKTSAQIRQKVVRKSAHTKYIITKDNIYINDLTEWIQSFNEIFHTKYRNGNLLANYTHWRDSYSKEEMLDALNYVYEHNWLREIHATPEIILRQKDHNQNPINWIGQLLSIKENKERRNRYEADNL